MGGGVQDREDERFSRQKSAKIWIIIKKAESTGATPELLRLLNF
jgi:hypothetical protein